MTSSGETSPARAKAQHRLSVLRGAACYAEFALLAGTWTTTGIEASLDGKGVGTRDATSGEGTRKYARYLKGSIPSDKTLSAISAKYPTTLLRFWAIHPIGQLLTDSDLSVDSVLRLLELLPVGPARQLVWVESPGVLAQTSFRREVPDDEETIAALADLRTTDALLALLGRHRLRRLVGQTEYDDVYEFALMDCFGDVVGGDPHLCLAKHVLIRAFADYLEWPCGSRTDQQPATDFDDGSRLRYWEEVAHQIDSARMQAELLGTSMPPKKYIDGFKGLQHRPAARPSPVPGLRKASSTNQA